MSPPMTLAALAPDSDFVRAAYIVAFVLFIVGVRQGTHPTTAKRGNMIAAAGMAVAVATTLALEGIGNWELIIGGIVVGAIIVVLMNVYRAEGSLTAGAATLGIVIGLLVLSLPQLGFGAYLLMRDRQEAAVAESAGKQRQMLGMIKARGQVSIADLAIELRISRDEVQRLLYELVNMGLYSGYINWTEGTLYSSEASELRNLDRCKNCSGQLELAGKGVIRCPFCGTEYFLP